MIAEYTMTGVYTVCNSTR